MAIQDEDFAENMRSFIGQCVLYDVALGRKYTIKDLRNTNNIWKLIATNASPARSFLWRDKTNRGEIVTCQAGVQKFNAVWADAVDQVACAAGAQLYPSTDMSSAPPPVGGSVDVHAESQCRSPLAKEQFLKFLPTHYGVMAAMGNDASDALKQQMMISALVDAQDHASMLAGNASNFAARKAYLQQRSSYETIGKLASDTLPIMRAVLELICYSLFLFIMPILVLPMGYKVLTSWAQTILWLAMWPPMYAILHLIMVSAISMKTRSYMGISNPSGITIASSLGVQNISADMAAMAGYLSISIPFICIAVVKGLSSFVHMSSSLGAVSQSAATGAANEAFTGNYQLGNTSMDNHSMGNVNMLSSSYNGNLSSGSTRFQDGHTSITSSMDGGMVANIEQSNLPVSINIAESIANNKRTAANHELSMGQSQMQSAEKSLSSAVDQIGNLGKTLSNSTNIQEGWTESDQQEAAKAFQKVDGVISKFAQDNSISKGKAAEVIAEAGTPLGGILGSRASTNLTSSSMDNELIQKAKEVSKSENLDESARIVEQATKHLSKNSSDDTIQSYMKSQQASLNEAGRDSELAQKHMEKSQRLSREADYVQSQSGTINRNMSQPFMEWLSTQPGEHSSGGEMGYRAAAGIVNQKPDVASLFATKFMNEHMPKVSLGMSESSLKSEYANTPIGSSVDKGVIDTLDKEAATKITHNLESKADGIENRVQNKMNDTKLLHASAQNKIDQGNQNLEQKYTQEKEKVGITEAALHGVNAVVSGVNKTVGAATEMAGKGLQYVADHSDVLMAANPMMFAHPSMMAPSGPVQDISQKNESVQMPEKNQKIVHIKKVVNQSESQPIDLNINRIDSLLTKKS
jgi:conjugal transfer mating pair stabilization protein TraG